MIFIKAGEKTEWLGLWMNIRVREHLVKSADIDSGLNKVNLLI